MRILFITSVYPRWEGDPSASFLVESIRHLRSSNCEVTVLAPSYHGLREHVVEGVRVRRFRYFIKRWENLTHGEGAPTRVKSPFYRFIALFYIIFGVAATYLECRTIQYDIIHVHWPFPHGLFGVVGTKVSRARLVCSFHGAELLLMRRFRYVRPFLRFVLRRTDTVTANSSFTAEQILALGKNHVEVIPYGWTIENRPIPADPGAYRSGQKEILFVGRLIQRKGLEYLVRAMPRIMAHTDAHLVIVGEGDEESRVRDLVRKLGLETRVQFTGVVSNQSLREHYRRCDIFVLPSIVDDSGDTEGLGVVLIEAMQFRKPVVAANVGGIRDVVIHGVTGLLVPQRDPDALADAVLRVFTEDGLGEKLGFAAKAYVEQKFNWTLITQAILECYTQDFKAAAVTETNSR